MCATKAGSLISEQRLDKLIGLYDELLLPPKELIHDIHATLQKGFTELQESQKFEFDAVQRVFLADSINKLVNSRQKTVANYLTRNEYRTLFDSEPGQDIILVNPTTISR